MQVADRCICLFNFAVCSTKMPHVSPVTSVRLWVSEWWWVALCCQDIRSCTSVQSRESRILLDFLVQHTHTQPFNGLWSGTTHVGRYQKKHSPSHTHPDRRTSFINFLHLLRSTASSLFSLRAWQSFLTTSLQVLFGLPLCFVPSTLYSMHFFTQSSS